VIHHAADKKKTKKISLTRSLARSLTNTSHQSSFLECSIGTTIKALAVGAITMRIEHAEVQVVIHTGRTHHARALAVVCATEVSVPMRLWELGKIGGNRNVFCESTEPTVTWWDGHDGVHPWVVKISCDSIAANPLNAAAVDSNHAPKGDVVATSRACAASALTIVCGTQRVLYISVRRKIRIVCCCVSHSVLGNSNINCFLLGITYICKFQFFFVKYALADLRKKLTIIFIVYKFEYYYKFHIF